MKHTIELDGCVLDNITLSQLKSIRASLKVDLKRVNKSKRGFVFDAEYKVDVIEIKKHIDALDLLVKYYGG